MSVGALIDEGGGQGEHWQRLGGGGDGAGEVDRINGAERWAADGWTAIGARDGREHMALGWRGSMTLCAASCFRLERWMDEGRVAKCGESRKTCRVRRARGTAGRRFLGGDAHPTRRTLALLLILITTYSLNPAGTSPVGLDEILPGGIARPRAPRCSSPSGIRSG